MSLMRRLYAPELAHCRSGPNRATHASLLRFRWCVVSSTALMNMRGVRKLLFHEGATRSDVPTPPDIAHHSPTKPRAVFRSPASRRVALAIRQSELGYPFVVPTVSGHQPHAMFDRGGSDQRVRKAHSCRSSYSAGVLGDQPGDRELGESVEEPAYLGLCFGASREQFRSGYDRVREAIVCSCPQLGCASEVIYEDVCVYEVVSHDPTRRDPGFRTQDESPASTSAPPAGLS